MIPLWTIPMAIATGNTLVLKPSERDPGASAIIAELCDRAGLPKGVLNIIHGGVDAVNFICDEPRIRAISFVGSDKAGKHIYDRGGANGKRVQANMGAKSALQLLKKPGDSWNLLTRCARTRSLHHYARCESPIRPEQHSWCCLRCCRAAVHVIYEISLSHSFPDREIGQGSFCARNGRGDR